MIERDPDELTPQPENSVRVTNPPADRFASTDDRRVESNLFRHQYRQLDGNEKLQMQAIKDQALALHVTMTAIGDSRELSLAKTRLEECVMWAVKHVTR